MAPMTHTLTKEAAKLVLEKHSLSLTQVIAAGWSRWRGLVTKDAELGAILSNRSRASIVYDSIRHEALVVFDGTEDVAVSEDRGFLLLTFEGKIVLRFKKFRSGTLRTSSVPTQQAREYAAQTLPGMESLTHLVAGYLPDELGIDLKRAAITCPVGSDLKWIIDLDLTQVVGDNAESRDLATVTQVETGETQVGTIVRPRRAGHDTNAAEQAFPSER